MIALSNSRTPSWCNRLLAAILVAALSLYAHSQPVLARQSLMIAGGHSLKVTAVAHGDAGRLVATGSEDRTAILWNAIDGKQLTQFVGHIDAVTSIAFNSDSKVLVTGSEDHTALVWNCETGKRLHTLKQHTGQVHSVDISPDGHLFVTGSADSSAIIWNQSDGRVEQTLVHGSDEVEAVTFSPDGKTVATATDRGFIAIWNSQSGTLVTRFKFEQRPLVDKFRGKMRLKFSDDGQCLLAFNRFDEISVWQVADQKQVFAMKSPTIDASIRNGSIVLCGKVLSEVRNVSTGSQSSATTFQTKTPGTSGGVSPTKPASMSKDGKIG